MPLSEILSARSETQVEIAAKVGVFQTTVSAWIRGKTLPPSTRIPALAAFLGMPIEQLTRIIKMDRRRRAKVHNLNLAEAE